MYDAKEVVEDVWRGKKSLPADGKLNADDARTATYKSLLNDEVICAFLHCQCALTNL